MNRQSLRQEIVADLDRLLQAAKDGTTNWEETKNGIAMKSDSRGRIFYYNIQKKRRATEQEIANAFKSDIMDTKINRAKEATNVAKEKLIQDASTATSNEAIRKVNEDAQGGKQGPKIPTEKLGLGDILKDRASYSKEAAGLAMSQASESLLKGYAGIHDYLSNKEDRQAFNKSATDAIGGLVGKAQGAMTTFAQTVMDGIGNKLQEAATNVKGSVDELMKQPEMIVLSGKMMGAMHAIQSATSPATSAMNTQIANMAFSINMANAQVQFLAARVNNAKLGKEGQGIIEAYQDALKEVKTPQDLEDLKEKFNKGIEDYKNRLEGERLANEVRKNETKELQQENLQDQVAEKEQFAKNRIKAINDNESGKEVPGKNLGSQMKSRGSAPIPSKK